MHGIRAYNTAGLRAQFAGSDLVVETSNPRVKLWLQVKSGYPALKDHVYLTQCSAATDLEANKFSADFVVCVNIDPAAAVAHTHDGRLEFPHLSFFVIPRTEANELYRAIVTRESARPKRDGTQRSLRNMALHATPAEMASYRDAWSLLRAAD